MGIRQRDGRARRRLRERGGAEEGVARRGRAGRGGRPGRPTHVLHEGLEGGGRPGRPTHVLQGGLEGGGRPGRPNHVIPGRRGRPDGERRVQADPLAPGQRDHRRGRRAAEPGDVERVVAAARPRRRHRLAPPRAVERRPGRTDRGAGVGHDDVPTRDRGGRSQRVSAGPCLGEDAGQQRDHAVQRAAVADLRAMARRGGLGRRIEDRDHRSLGGSRVGESLHDERDRPLTDRIVTAERAERAEVRRADHHRVHRAGREQARGVAQRLRAGVFARRHGVRRPLQVEDRGDAVRDEVRQRALHAPGGQRRRDRVARRGVGAELAQHGLDHVQVDAHADHRAGARGIEPRHLCERVGGHVEQRHLLRQDLGELAGRDAEPRWIDMDRVDPGAPGRRAQAAGDGRGRSREQRAPVEQGVGDPVGPSRRADPRPHADHRQVLGRDAQHGGLRQRGRSLGGRHDHVRVRTAEAERADAGDPAVGRPRRRRVEHGQALSVDAVDRRAARGGRQHRVAYGAHGADQPRETRHGDRVPDQALAGREHQRRRARAVQGRERVDLDRVAERRAGGVALDVAERRRREPSAVVRRAQRAELTVGVRREQVALAAVVPETRAADHRVDPVAVTQRVAQALQRDRRGPLADDQPVRAPIQRAGRTAARQRPKLREAEEEVGRVGALGARGDGDVAQARLESIAREGDRVQARRARRVERGGVSAEAERALREPGRAGAVIEVEVRAAREERRIVAALGEPRPPRARRRAERPGGRDRQVREQQVGAVARLVAERAAHHAEHLPKHRIERVEVDPVQREAARIDRHVGDEPADQRGHRVRRAGRRIEHRGGRHRPPTLGHRDEGGLGAPATAQPRLGAVGAGQQAVHADDREVHGAPRR